MVINGKPARNSIAPKTHAALYQCPNYGAVIPGINTFIETRVKKLVSISQRINLSFARLLNLVKRARGIQTTTLGRTK